VKRCKTTLRNFEWQRQRARVNWTDCCACKAVAVLGLIDLEADLLDLLCKWIFMPLELGDSNLRILLRFKLAQSNPSWHNRWTLDLNWAMVKGQVSTPGCKFWGQIMKTWKYMVEKFNLAPPWVVDWIQRVKLWWGSSFKGEDFGISIHRAQELHKVGLWIVGDIWNF